jgi:hypothetical protein
VAERAARRSLVHEPLPDRDGRGLDLPARSGGCVSEPPCVYAPVPGRMGAAVQGTWDARRVPLDAAVRHPGLSSRPAARSARARAGAMGSTRYGRPGRCRSQVRSRLTRTLRPRRRGGPSLDARRARCDRGRDRAFRTEPSLDRARIKTFRTAFAVPAVGSVHLRKKAE